MHLFQPSFQFASIALLMPALMATAYPHSRDQGSPNVPRAAQGDILKLYKYPSQSDLFPIGKVQLGEQRTAQSGRSKVTSYDVEWKKQESDNVGTPAIATPIQRDQYNTVVDVLGLGGTLLASGQDEEKQLWVIVSRAGGSGRERPIQEDEGRVDKERITS